MGQHEYKDLYNVDCIKLIRNNNIVYGKSNVDIDKDMYFMLDYFDLLFHQKLAEGDKVYRKFWNLEHDISEKNMEYKASFKILSLYSSINNSSNDSDIWDGSDTTMSSMPFIGIVQINIIFDKCSVTPNIENDLDRLQDWILTCSRSVFADEKKTVDELQMLMHIYKSSTSSDFCLVVRSNVIKSIYRIASSINNKPLYLDDNEYAFNTYTNIGIECRRNDDGLFCTIPENIIQLNQDCTFALRVSASYGNFLKKNKDLIKDASILDNCTYGLFGRYDLLVNMTIDQFASLYPSLCQSKIMGYESVVK